MSLERVVKGTPLESRILPDIPTVSTPLGEVQIGSALSYQVNINCKSGHNTLGMHGACVYNVLPFSYVLGFI